jgi:hypothetical protein
LASEKISLCFIVDVFVCLVFKEQSVKNSFIIIFPTE